MLPRAAPDWYPRVEIHAARPVVRVKEIVDEAIDLEMVGDVIGSVDVDFGVAADRFVLVGIIANEELIADGNEICAELPFRGQSIIETGLEPILGDARYDIAGMHKNEKLLTSVRHLPMD